MDIEHPRFEEYEQRFRALAENVSMQKGAQPEMASARLLLFLYGENGLPPEEEFKLLATLENHGDELKGATIITSYWEDIALYVPGA